MPLTKSTYGYHLLLSWNVFWNYWLISDVRRHLLRLWLRDSEYAWETPLQLQGRWDEIYKGLSEEEQRFPLEPTLRNVVSAKVRKD
jgi:hypothetical protein